MTNLESFLFVKYTLPIAVVFLFLFLLFLFLLAVIGGITYLIVLFKNERKDNKSDS